MKSFLNILFLFAGLFIESGSICAWDYITKKGSTEGGIRIAWDYSSMQKLAPLGNRKLSWLLILILIHLNRGYKCY